MKYTYIYIYIERERVCMSVSKRERECVCVSVQERVTPVAGMVFFETDKSDDFSRSKSPRKKFPACFK